MMGLSWEMEPTLRKLEIHYPDLKIESVMSLLVKDIRLFMLKDESFDDYNKRLATIYLSEKSIGNMPMNMNNLHLFSEQFMTTLPLNAAVKVIERMDPARKEEFVYRLRYETIVNQKQTTNPQVIEEIVKATGFDVQEYQKVLKSGLAFQDLEADLVLFQSLPTYQLPAYLLSFQGQSILLKGTPSYSTFKEAIDQITQGQVQEISIEDLQKALDTLLKNHPLISTVEILAALNLSSLEGLKLGNRKRWQEIESEFWEEEQ